MPKILCFGDSNTYGFDPRDWFDCRYPSSVRWPDRLAASTGWQVQNCGENGREIPHTQWALRQFDQLLEQERPMDCLLIMLGTNDVLNDYRPSASAAAARMEQFLRHITEKKAGRKEEPFPILLIAPAPVKGIDSSKDLASEELCASYEELAKDFSIPFANAGQWNIPLAFDGVHFSEEGHAAFAKEIEAVLRDLWKEREE